MKRAIAVILFVTLVSSFSSVAAVIWPEQTPGLPYETHVYEPFGADFDDIGVPILGDQDIRYTGKPFDASTGKHYFNARYLNTITDTASPGLPPRFLTPDIIEGTPGNPQSRNRYASCLNDLVGYVDPDGKRFLLADNSSECFKREVEIAIQHANEHGASGVLAKLHAMKAIVFLKESKSQKNYFNPSENTIYWTGKYASESSDGTRQPALLFLIHEVGHALLFNQNPKEFRNNLNHKYTKKHKFSEYQNEEERRVIMDIEWPAAGKLGYDKRTTHFEKRRYRTRSPVTTDELFNFKYSLTINATP